VTSAGETIDEMLAEGLGLERAGRREPAVELYREILRLAPGNPGALHRLGCLAAQRGNLRRALELLSRAARIAAERAEIRSDYGRILHSCGNHVAAAPELEAALRIDPARAGDAVLLGDCYLASGQSGKALEAYRMALHAEPGSFSALFGINHALMTQGNLEAGLRAWKEALERDPGPQAHSDFLLVAHCLPQIDRDLLFREHLGFAERYERPLRAGWKPHANSRDPERRLRVGYVSADFRRHAVGLFLRPLLEEHDLEQFEIYCYSSVATPDSYTALFRSLAGAHWREIRGMDDGAAADLIRRDGIDILLDLGGHTGGNRLLVFARKPAPVQITWLGYVATTGLSSMDYRVTDRWADPPGMTEHLYSERLLRLAEGFWCFGAPSTAPPVTAPPCVRNGYVTFGSFNNFMKLSAPTLDLWAAILRQVEGSRLVLRHRGGADEDARAFLLSRFAALGVSADRIVIQMPIGPYRLHLSSYREVDIGLDPFPYNGGTTTTEALYMGVPVVTLAGNSFVSRMGASLLSQVGQDEWIAATPAEYCEIAARWAQSRERLPALRQALRSRVENSGLGNAKLFARRMEAGLRLAWKQWLEEAPVQSHPESHPVARTQ
jgi:tetratricopeptide (TPR) repeat protein